MDSFSFSVTPVNISQCTENWGNTLYSPIVSTGERGLLVELYEGEYFESNFFQEASWAALSPSHAGYKSFVPDAVELKFPIEITQDTVGIGKGEIISTLCAVQILTVRMNGSTLCVLSWHYEAKLV